MLRVTSAAQNKGMHTWHQPIKSKGSDGLRQTDAGVEWELSVNSLSKALSDTPCLNNLSC